MLWPGCELIGRKISGHFHNDLLGLRTRQELRIFPGGLLLGRVLCRDNNGAPPGRDTATGLVVNWEDFGAERELVSDLVRDHAQTRWGIEMDTHLPGRELGPGGVEV